MRNSKNQGITLIALVVTIVVLLILAGVSISMLTGENGIITQANESGKRTTHGNVVERLNINSTTHTMDKTIDESTLTLIEYLQEKEIIGNEIGESSGKYQINVTKLTTEIQKYGNGTATESEKKDVYMLEKDTEENSKVIYEIKYYEKSTGESEVLGELTDTVKEASDEITFYISKFLIDNGDWIHININKGYKAKEGMTWGEWLNSSYGDTFRTDFNNEFSSEGCAIGPKLPQFVNGDEVICFMFKDESDLGKGQLIAMCENTSGDYSYLGDTHLVPDAIIDPTKDYFLRSEWISE